MTFEIAISCRQYHVMKEGNALFNNTLTTFYLSLYDVRQRHVLKDHSVREETCCPHFMGYFETAAKDLLYAPFHRQSNIYHDLCYTSCEVLAGMRNSSTGPPWEISPTAHHITSGRSTTRATSCPTMSWA